MRADRTSTQDVAGYAVARAADGAGTAQGHARLTARAARRDDDTTPGPWPLLGVVAYLVMVGMNGLANALPLFGNSTAEVSRRYPTLFTPAPFTFAVWGVIYLLLGAFAVYQALPTNSVPIDTGSGIATSITVSSSIGRAIGLLNPAHHFRI